MGLEGDGLGLLYNSAILKFDDRLSYGILKSNLVFGDTQLPNSWSQINLAIYSIFLPPTRMSVFPH